MALHSAHSKQARRENVKCNHLILRVNPMLMDGRREEIEVPKATRCSHFKLFFLKRYRRLLRSRGSRNK